MRLPELLKIKASRQEHGEARVLAAPLPPIEDLWSPLSTPKQYSLPRLQVPPVPGLREVKPALWAPVWAGDSFGATESGSSTFITGELTTSVEPSGGIFFLFVSKQGLIQPRLVSHILCS